MRVKRSRGALSGLLLILLGAGVALVPFIGPVFDYTVGPTSAWTWTAGRFWLNVLPGAAAFVAGLVVLGAGRRGRLGFASWAATIAGMWIVVGPEVSRVWNHGVIQSGNAYGGTHRQVVELLGYSLLSGALIAAIGAFSLGRASLVTVSDIRYDNAMREQEIIEAERPPTLSHADRRLEPDETETRGRHSLFDRRRPIDLRDDRSQEADDAAVASEEPTDAPRN